MPDRADGRSRPWFRRVNRTQRRIVRLLCQEGLSNKEIAWRIGKPYCTVKTWLSLAYRQLGVRGGDRELIVRYWRGKLS